MNGTALSSEQKVNSWAKGIPTVDLWVNSWNASYPSDTSYIRYVDTEDIDEENFWATGYAIGDSANPTTCHFDLSYENINNTLYFPCPENLFDEYCYGYWLASPSASGDDDVMAVDYDGYIICSNYSYYGNFGFRPIVCLPSSIVNQ
ncbi:MAG: hypothetical protein IJH39_01345 [Clostridia bacterium]|nr:hypothetical protein [Clostridia bacterium]